MPNLANFRLTELGINSVLEDLFYGNFFFFFFFFYFYKIIIIKSGAEECRSAAVQKPWAIFFIRHLSDHIFLPMARPIQNLEFRHLDEHVT